MTQFLVPKLNFLYFKDILDICFKQFFKDFNDDFIKSGDVYVYGKHATKSKLKSVFRAYIKTELKKYITPNSANNGNYYFIIGSCCPKDNILLQYKDATFPKKLLKLLQSDYHIKYYIKEKDIKLDLVFFNSIFDELFCEFFKDRYKVLKYIGKEYTNLFFIQHHRLDCMTIYELIRKEYGKKNVVNLHKKYLQKLTPILISINEHIDKCTHNAKKMFANNEYNLIIAEVKQYVSECMRISNGKK